ncbi:LPS translocon maturation chaperone LptM [Legionella rubrilucens]|nr:lipoprotein [Legionella rubrilucens]
MTLFRHGVLLAVMTLLLAACGQKGPLYLPDTPPHSSKVH